MSRGLEVLIFGEAGSGGEGGSTKGDKGGKKLILNEQSGMVYVKDYSDNMNKIEAFLEDIQNSVRRQVMIQAHFIEVTLNDTYALGVDWKGFEFMDGNVISVSQKLIPLAAEQFFQVNLTNNKFNAILDAMKQQGTLNILSSPRISAINNQKALVKLTSRQVSWLTKTTVIPGTSNITETTNTPQVDEVGIFLDVTPQIDEEDMVTLYIHPSISEITEISVSPDKRSNMPVISTREVDTIVNARTGQTVVIAGLIKDRISETKRSVPLLGDIPYVGKLFSQVSQEKTKTELVILLTPYILNRQHVSEMSRESEERLRMMGRKFQSVPQLDAP
ncbi:MAG: type II secretion system protein GspD [Thermodesulfovibrionales bacterium]